MASILPQHYNVHIISDLPNFTFEGEITIQMVAKKATDTILLDSLELNYSSIMLTGNDQELPYTLDLENQKVIISLPEEIRGEITLNIKYNGEINDKLAGLYRSRYQIDGEERVVAVTQFQETDARRAFPCFDSPEYKTTYSISFTVPKDYKTISNTSIERVEELQEGKKRVYFEDTPKMSSYLVFFGFGEFEWIEEKYRDIPLRVVTAPGKAKNYGGLAMDYGKKSLMYCEEYFGVDYPLSKMDLIATPDFAAGAMENWGAVLFRENALLYYPGITTENGKLGIKITISHEIAHQWFGNLVSPDKWKFVWLNESFATYFAYKTIDHFEPEYGVFDNFISNTTNGALSADGYDQTAPIEQEGDEPAAYTVKTIPILYNKGGSVLRQLEGYLGDDMFQHGLQHYIKKHSYDVAGSSDLWVAFETVSGEPISELMEQWVKQLGYPIVTVEKDQNKLVLRQSRFTYVGKEYDTLWMIPLTLRQYLKNGEILNSTHLMKEQLSEIELDPECDVFKINTDMTGFYRVRYDSWTYTKFEEMIKNNSLSSSDRYNIENDLYALLTATEIELDYYLSYLEHYQNDKSHLTLKSISNHLNSLYTILEGDAQQQLAERGRTFHESFLDKFGYDKTDDESHTITMMRGTVINRAAKFGSETAQQFSREFLEKIKTGKEVDPNLLPSVLSVIARLDNDFDFFLSKFKAAESEAEKQYYSMAMFNFTTPENIEKLQEFVFEEIPARNRGGAIATMTNNPAAKDNMWEFYLANLDNFEKLHPFTYQGALTMVIIASVKYRDEVVNFFEEYVKKNPQVQDPVDKALETLDIRAQLAEKYS